MNILVCVKQVPSVVTVSIDENKHTLRRDTSQSEINPFDLYALEGAARFKDADTSSKIIALSMGPLSADSVLKDALTIAADGAYLISDELFSGADVRLTAQIIRQAIRVIEAKEGKFDVICCGAKSTDGNVSAFAPMLAFSMNLPVVTYATTCKRKYDELYIWKEREKDSLSLKVRLPCVVSFTKAAFPVRYPEMSRIISVSSAVIPVLTSEDLYKHGEFEGKKKNREIEIKSHRFFSVKRSSRIIKGKSAEAAAEILASMLQESNTI